MDNYQWTRHSLYKMKQYGLSRQRIKRVIRVPKRVEEGIVNNTIACMQKAGSAKHPYEIWAMYQLRKGEANSPATAGPRQGGGKQVLNSTNHQLRIISAWKYPGTSPRNNPIPREILEEIENLKLNS